MEASRYGGFFCLKGKDNLNLIFTEVILSSREQDLVEKVFLWKF